MSFKTIERDARRAAASQGTEIHRHPEVDAYIGEVLNTAAHLLRTPMTPLLLDIASLKRHLRPEGDALLASLSRNLLRLQQTVEDFVDLATIRRDGIPVQQCDLGDSVTQAIASSCAPERCQYTPNSAGALGEPNWIGRALAGVLDMVLQDTAEAVQIDVIAGEHPEIRVTSTMAAERAWETMDAFDPRAANHATATMGMSVAQAVAHSFDGFLEVTGDTKSSTVAWHFMAPT